MEHYSMAKKKPAILTRSYGIYSQWDSKSKLLPQIKEFTTEVPAQLDIEFGMIINIQSARGKKISYCIDHPGIVDDQGKVRTPFTGEVHINNNDWSFYLGDTVWAPINDKCGLWRMTIEFNGEIIADKSFNVLFDKPDSLVKKRFNYF